MSDDHTRYTPLVLCVDDDKWILDLLRKSLERKGYRVLVAASGREALKVFAAFPIDVAILDYDMPEMNGSEVAREMARMKPGVPRLLFSGNECMPEDESEVFQGYWYVLSDIVDGDAIPSIKKTAQVMRFPATRVVMRPGA